MKKNFCYFAIILQIFLALPVQAETISDVQILSINPLDEGRAEIVVKGNSGVSSFIISNQTLIEAALPAKKVKSGHFIFRPEGAPAPAAANGGGGRKRGFRSPFGGLSKSMRKSMGLPDIASVPEVPNSRPAEIPKIPKVPKGPKGRTSPSIVDPNGKPTAEEEELYGRMESDRGVMSKDGKAASIIATPINEEPAFVKTPTQRVLSVEPTEEGVKLELETSGGQTEELMVAADKEVLQVLSLRDLRKNMKVQLEVQEASEGLLAQKITVRG